MGARTAETENDVTHVIDFSAETQTLSKCSLIYEDFDGFIGPNAKEAMETTDLKQPSRRKERDV
jgi:hypothetical protein